MCALWCFGKLNFKSTSLKTNLLYMLYFKIWASDNSRIECISHGALFKKQNESCLLKDFFPILTSDNFLSINAHSLFYCTWGSCEFALWVREDWIVLMLLSLALPGHEGFDLGYSVQMGGGIIADWEEYPYIGAETLTAKESVFHSLWG